MRVIKVQPVRRQVQWNSENVPKKNDKTDENTLATKHETVEHEDRTSLSKKEILHQEEINSMQSLWQEFRESTTMHGLKHARRENKYQLRWIIWLIALGGMGIALVYTMVTLISYYGTNPTLTNIKVQFVPELSYPAVSICNLSPFKKSKVNASTVLATHLLHTSRLGVILPRLNYSNPDLSELHNPVPNYWLKNVSFDLNDMFEYCVNERRIVPCKDILLPKITQWGKCFTYNHIDKIMKSGRKKSSNTGSATALTFYMDIRQDEYVYNVNLGAGAKIVLHDPKEEPDVNNKGFIVPSGMSTYVSIKMTEYKYLPKPYKAGGDRFCVDTNKPDFVNHLKYYPYYSKTACLLECRRDYIVHKCGCRSVTDPGNETLCSPAAIATCYNDNEVEFDSNGDLKEQCQCEIPCQFTTFDQTISTATFPADVYLPPLQSLGYKDIEKNTLEVRLFYDSLSYLSVESIPEYNSEDIVGILGGQMGIFLGASLLTLSELLEFLILAVSVFIKKCCCVYKKRESSQDKEQFY